MIDRRALQDNHPLQPLPEPDRMDDDALADAAAEWVRSRPDPQNIWVFATGSLMWNPEFPYTECRRGRVEGWHRAFCLYSVNYRGSPARPGLVMGLAPGGYCEGCAFRIDPGNREDAAVTLWRREMGHGSYRMIDLDIETAEGTIHGSAFTPTEGHPQYAVGLPRQTVSAAIACASGKRGPNLDYFTATRDHLLEMGIVDPYIEAIAEDLSGCI